MSKPWAARMKFFQLNPDFSLREFGIAIKPMPSPEEKQLLFHPDAERRCARVRHPRRLDDTERYMEVSMDAAAMYLTYVIKKAKDRPFQEQQLVHTNSRANEQPAQMIKNRQKQDTAL
jgi:hypothetical protein